MTKSRNLAIAATASALCLAAGRAWAQDYRDHPGQNPDLRAQ